MTEERPIPGQFTGFIALSVATSRVGFCGVMGGMGTPVILLHGYPQTHAAWHDVAPAVIPRRDLTPEMPLRVAREPNGIIERRGCQPTTMVSDNGTHLTSDAILRWQEERGAR